MIEDEARLPADTLIRLRFTDGNFRLLIGRRPDRHRIHLLFQPAGRTRLDQRDRTDLGQWLALGEAVVISFENLSDALLTQTQLFRERDGEPANASAKRTRTRSQPKRPRRDRVV